MSDISKIKLPNDTTVYNIKDAEARQMIEAIPTPMQFKGTLGEGGTIISLPPARETNQGFVYKVITAGTYAGQEAKVGDTFVSDGSQWVLIPSGDEPSGTVTNIATGTGLTGGPITTSGTISVDTSVIATKAYADGKITNPSTKSANQILKYNGTSWEAANAIEATEAVTQTITGNGSTTTFTVNHTFNTRNVAVFVYDAQYKDVIVDITRTSTSQVTIEFGTAPASGETYTAVVSPIAGVKGDKGDPGTGSVEDVRINGASILVNKIANITTVSTIDTSGGLPTSAAVKTYVDNAIASAIANAINGSY